MKRKSSAARSKSSEYPLGGLRICQKKLTNIDTYCTTNSDFVHPYLRKADRCEAVRSP